MLGYVEESDANEDPVWASFTLPEVGGQLVLHPSTCSLRSGLSGDRAIGDRGRSDSVFSGECWAVRFDVCAPRGGGSLTAYTRPFSNSLGTERQREYLCGDE